MKALDEHGAMNGDEYEQREIRFAPQTFRVRSDGTFEYLERDERGQWRPAPEPEWQIVRRETSKMSYANPAPSEPSPLDLYALDDACDRFFPGLDMKPEDLRALAKRKKLRFVRVRGRVLVRGTAIREMIECLESGNRPVSGSTQSAASMRSSTPAEKSALAYLRTMTTAKPPKPNLRNTSPAKARSRKIREPANVVHLRSP